MRPIIEQGHVYCAQPPLYKVEKNKKIAYLYSDEELALYLEEIGKKGAEVQRYKGLGEMNKEQLWETTMNPEKRTLVKIKMEDALLADELFTILMGENADLRKQFIAENATLVNADELDV